MTDARRPLPPIPPSEQPARLAALVAAVRARTDLVPRVGIVLGSGLGSLADDLEDPVVDPVRGPARLAGGHGARARGPAAAGPPRAACPSWCSRAASTCTRATTPGLVVQPVLLFRQLGAELVILTNAAGGVNPAYGPGTLMVITRPHQPHRADAAAGPERGRARPALRRHDGRLGARATGRRLRAAGEAEGVALEEGVYVGLLGPSYETPAEVRMLRTHGRGRRRHVDGARGDRGALGRPRGVRRLARDERRRRVQRRSR